MACVSIRQMCLNFLLVEFYVTANFLLLMHCMKMDRRNLVFIIVKHSGVIPTSEIVKATEKLDTNQCAKVSCGTEVGQPSQGCSESDRQPLLSQVNPLLECCRMIKCDRSNGSYSLELGDLLK